MITDTVIRATITGVAQGRYGHGTLRDSGERGGGRLVLQIRKTKSKPSAEWFVVWQRKSVRYSTKMGTYPATSLAKARQLFRERYQPDILEGRNPQGPRVWRNSEGLTIENMLESYVQPMERDGRPCARRYREILLGPTGFAEAVGRDRLASEIAAADIVPFLKVLHDRNKKPFAEFVRACIRGAFQFALKSKYDVSTDACGVDWGLRGNPADFIPRIKYDKARNRALSPTEFRAFFLWLAEERRKPRSANFAAALQLVMLTGQRCTEILSLSETHWDPLERMLSWTTTKNGRPHNIPVCDQAIEVLAALQPNVNGLFFPRLQSPERPAHHDGAMAMVDRYLRETGAAHFQVRDLRRTWKSLAGDAAIPKEACDRIQNHAYRDVGSIHYDRSDHWYIKSVAIERWSQVVDFILYSDGSVTRRSLGRSTLTLGGGPAALLPTSGHQSLPPP